LNKVIKLHQSRNRFYWMVASKNWS